MVVPLSTTGSKVCSTSCSADAVFDACWRCDVLEDAAGLANARAADVAASSLVRIDPSPFMCSARPRLRNGTNSEHASSACGASAQGQVMASASHASGLASCRPQLPAAAGQGQFINNHWRLLQQSALAQ